MEKISYIIVLFVLGAFSASRAFYWLSTPKDELYSLYRNTIDISPSDFKKHLMQKRVLWTVLAATLLPSAFFLLFK